MDYAAWKLFIDTAELGSLSKAAIAYGTSQPHVSRQISDLEQAYGGRLFQRTGRGVVLTELGQRVLPKVRAWLAGTEQLANDIRTTAGTPVGTVRLGILPSTAHPLVSRLHFHLRDHFPLVQLEVREGQGAQLETWLESGRVDLAVLFRHSETPQNGDIYLVDTATYLVSAADDPITAQPVVPFSTLNELPMVMFCRPNSWRDRLDVIAREYGVALKVVLEADSLALQTHVVAEGGGYALLGPYAVSAATHECALRASKIVEPTIPRPIALAMSRHGELTLACKTVMRVIQEIVQTKSSSLPKTNTE